MGVFDRLFGRKNPPHPPEREDEEEEDEFIASTQSTADQPIDGPPEFVRAVEVQRAYWTYDADEQSRLERQGFEQLDWRERLRLHHLTCLQRLRAAGPERALATEKCREIVRRLAAADSPYRRRSAILWQRTSDHLGDERDPDLHGELLNASITHLGCLEIYRVHATDQPSRMEFVCFDDLAGVVFAPPHLIRGAKLNYEDGRSEIVRLPLLYGLTWAIGNQYDRAGRMTRFVADLKDPDIGRVGASGLGIGHQDLTLRRADGSCDLLGLGSVSEIAFPLDVSDPRFDEKARARGLDPDDVRRQAL